MCDFSPNIPKVVAPPPPAPVGTGPKLSDPLAGNAGGALGADGSMLRGRRMGLSSLQIDRPESSGLTIPRA